MWTTKQNTRQERLSKQGTIIQHNKGRTHHGAKPGDSRHVSATLGHAEGGVELWKMRLYPGLDLGLGQALHSISKETADQSGPVTPSHVADWRQD